MRWPGFREDGSLALPLDPQPLLPPGMPLRLRLDGHVLERKRELHMTLLGRDAGSALRSQLGEDHVRGLFRVDVRPRPAVEPACILAIEGVQALQRIRFHFLDVAHVDLPPPGRAGNPEGLGQP